VNSYKENARVVKTYVCNCGEVNKFSLETDFDVTEVRIDAHCQGCGKEISISVENFFRASGNTNINNYSQQSNNTNHYGSNTHNNQNYSNNSNSQNSYCPASSDSSASTQAGMQEFNFDALTSAAGSMSTSSTEVQQTQNQNNDVINSLSDDVMQEVDSNAPEVAESPVPLATNITPARKIINEVEKEEEKDLLSEQEDGSYGEEASSDEQEAFIDLFGRL